MQEFEREINDNSFCPVFSPEDLSLYLDDLHERDAELTEHIADCPLCRKELAFQRSLALALAVSGEEISPPVLPPDFAKRVAVAAESNVERLRSRHELTSAGLICVAVLALLVTLAGTSAAAFSLNLYSILERATAIASVFGQLLWHLTLSVIVIIRSLGAALPHQGSIWLAGLLLGMTVLFLGRRLFRTVQSRGV